MCGTYTEKSLATLALVLVLASGCGDKSETADEGPTVADQLVGTWKSACIKNTAGSELKAVVFTKETFNFTSTTYTDQTCTTVDNILTGVGTYKLNGTTHSDKAGELNNADYKFITYTWTFAKDPLLATDYAKSCGSTAISGVVDVAGKTCDLGGGVTATFNSPAFGTFAFESGTLLVTDFDTNGATADKRSATIVTGQKLGWTKQPEATTGS